MSAPPPDGDQDDKPRPGKFYFIQTQTGWQRTLKAFADWCAPQAGWRVLDAGCG
jgi:hypothetical protein